MVLGPTTNFEVTLVMISGLVLALPLPFLVTSKEKNSAER
jgi:hypothetical protein